MIMPKNNFSISQKKPSPTEIKARNYKNYGEKIKKFRQAAGLTAEELAASLNISKGSVRNWECGLSRPDPEALVQLFSLLDVEPNVFFNIGGIGTVLTPQEKNLLRHFRTLDDESKEDLESFAALLSEKAHTRQLKKYLASLCPVSIRGRHAAAGDGSDWEPYPEEEKLLLYNMPDVAKADEIFMVSGESMSPMFENGDKVLVQYCNHIRNGEIGIYYVPGHGGVIKQAAYDRLHSLNPDYDDIFPYEDGAKIIGRVLTKITPEMIPTLKEQQLYAEAAAQFLREEDS